MRMPVSRCRPATLRAMAWLLLAPLPAALVTAWIHPRAPAFTEVARAERMAEKAAVEAAETLELSEVRARFSQWLWVDARAADAFATGHARGAVRLNEDAWETGFGALVEAWDGTSPIVVYCAASGCDVSVVVARRLRSELGFAEVHALRGGWEALRAEGEAVR